MTVIDKVDEECIYIMTFVKNYSVKTSSNIDSLDLLNLVKSKTCLEDKYNICMSFQHPTMSLDLLNLIKLKTCLKDKYNICLSFQHPTE